MTNKPIDPWHPIPGDKRDRGPTPARPYGTAHDLPGQHSGDINPVDPATTPAFRQRVARTAELAAEAAVQKAEAELAAAKAAEAEAGKG